jgi:hypothetical protein
MQCSTHWSRRLDAIPCRVCGFEFTPSREDAVTCTSTCRQRLRKGQEFAYFEALTRKQQRIERDLHAALDAGREASRNLARLIREHSLESRQERQEAERVAESTQKELYRLLELGLATRDAMDNERDHP